MIIDTHIHLDSNAYSEDVDEVIRRSEAQGVKQFIIPGADPKTLERAIQLAEQYENVFFSVGVHPYDIDAFKEDIFDVAKHPKCVAIGECGLDYFRLEGTEEYKNSIKQQQQVVFEKQIEIAISLALPLIVHIRDASSDALAILNTHVERLHGGVLHCFNADEQLLSLAKHNFYYGIGGVLTFKNAKKLVNILPKIPTNRLLIETDGPYLTPHPHRGTRNEPMYCKLVAKKMAELLTLQSSDIESLAQANTYELFTNITAPKTA